MATTKIIKETPWQRIGRKVYGLVGLTAAASIVWAVFKIKAHEFSSSMGLLGSIAFWILIVGGVNWGIKSVFGKDIFGN